MLKENRKGLSFTLIYFHASSLPVFFSNLYTAQQKNKNHILNQAKLLLTPILFKFCLHKILLLLRHLADNLCWTLTNSYFHLQMRIIYIVVCQSYYSRINAGYLRETKENNALDSDLYAVASNH